MGTARVLRSWRAFAIISFVAVLLLSGTRADGRPAPARQPPPTIEIIPVENPDPINAPSLIVSDTTTGHLLGTYHLDLPDQLGHVASNDATPGVVLLGAGGGVVWLRAGIGSGTRVRVTVPAAPRG